MSETGPPMRRQMTPAAGAIIGFACGIGVGVGLGDPLLGIMVGVLSGALMGYLLRRNDTTDADSNTENDPGHGDDSTTDANNEAEDG